MPPCPNLNRAKVALRPETTRLTAPAGATRLSRDSFVEVDGQPDLWDRTARECPVSDLPDEALGFLLASRYCETDLMMAQVWDLFGSVAPGWTRVRAIFDYVNQHLTPSSMNMRAPPVPHQRPGESGSVSVAILRITPLHCAAA